MKKNYKFYYYNLTKKSINGKKQIADNINNYVKFVFSVIETEPPKKLLKDLFKKI